MADSDGDIEFLDEDADIVQQCVQAAPVPIPVLVPKVEVEENIESVPLLIERQPVERKRKRRKDEEDSDYDPNDDVLPPSPAPSSKSKKKRQNVVKKVKSYHREGVPNLKVAPKENRFQYTGPRKKPKHFPVREVILDRKKCKIRIPDYDDPLCLPVKAVKNEALDIKRLNNWNNVCLEHFKHCDSLLKPERGDTRSSARTVVFRNVINKQSGWYNI